MSIFDCRWKDDLFEEVEYAYKKSDMSLQEFFIFMLELLRYFVEYADD